MHFVLDQNFPWQAMDLPWPKGLRLTRLYDLAPHLTTDYEDWQVLWELAHRGDVDGVITNDAKMLNLATEMAVLQRSRLVLVTTDGVGHDPIRATGLVMVHLQQIIKQPDVRPHVYVLRAANLQSSKPGRHIDRIAKQRRLEPNNLLSNEVERIRAWELGRTSGAPEA